MKPRRFITNTKIVSVSLSEMIIIFWLFIRFLIEALNWNYRKI